MTQMSARVSARACWTAENARAILVTEALAGEDALFLATHTPVRGFEVGGSAKDVSEPTEEALLQALSDPERRHAFCVVQGEPGSGKSHLIRWLSVNWPEGRDLCLLVQRANGSLEGALRQLQSRLPEEFQPLFNKLGRRQAAGISGRANNFLVMLGSALDPDHFTKPLEDSNWCRENDPSSLVLNTHVRRHWAGPLRILQLMDGGTGERNSATASFNLEDVIDLARYCPEVHDGVASERLARRLIKEAAFMAEVRAEGRSWDEIVAEHAGEVRQSLALIDALNARRNYAVQNVIGVSADGLKKLFEELRTELAKRNQRVVLLLEDITSWEGLDDSLVDALVTDAATRPDDLCPLISVVGVTPEYFAKLPGNYRQRITHDVKLGQVRGVLQDVAALREPEDRSAFVARYLGAARAGLDELMVWREQFRTERELAPPNRCNGCVCVAECHETFGAVEGVGLFPFTSSAVDNFFFALKEDDAGMTHRTPRGLVQAVLSPTLLHPKVIEDGLYPGPQIETSALDRRSLPGVLESRLTANVENPVGRDRLRRLLAYWGDRRPEIRRNAAGEQQYAGLSRKLVAAFNLPWIAEDVTEGVTGPSPGPIDPLPPRPSPTPPSVGAATPGDAGPKPSGATTGIVGPKVKPARPANTSRAQLEKLRAEIAALREGRPLQNSTGWNGVLFDVLRGLDFRRLGVDRWTWSKIFTHETVKIAGTGQVRAAHFVVDRSEWLIDGLEAYATLRTEDLTEEEAEYSRRRLAFMTRRLEALATGHAARRVPEISAGVPWNPVASVVEVLLARAWLRGATTPDRPTHEQWTAILSEESDAESDPGARTQAWQDALSATKGRHDLLRKALHEMVRLPQGGSANFGIGDASAAASALARMIERCELSALPGTPGEVLPTDMEAVREVAARLGALPDIPAQERKLLTGRAEQLFGLLREQAIPAHLARLDTVINSVSAQLPEFLPHLVRDWKAALERQRRLLDEPTISQAVQTAMIEVTDEAESLPARRSALLGKLASAPAAQLKAALDLAQFGERLAGELLPHVRDLVREAGGGVNLTEIHAHGAALRAAAASARALLGEDSR